jgi:hypothetical protein
MPIITRTTRRIPRASASHRPPSGAVWRRGQALVRTGGVAVVGTGYQSPTIPDRICTTSGASAANA